MWRRSPSKRLCQALNLRSIAYMCGLSNRYFHRVVQWIYSQQWVILDGSKHLDSLAAQHYIDR